MTSDEIMALAEKAGLTSLSLIDVAYLERFSALVSAAERDRIESEGVSLYEKTGDIKDINTIMIQRSAILARGQQ